MVTTYWRDQSSKLHFAPKSQGHKGKYLFFRYLNTNHKLNKQTKMSDSEMTAVMKVVHMETVKFEFNKA